MQTEPYILEEDDEDTYAYPTRSRFIRLDLRACNLESPQFTFPCFDISQSTQPFSPPSDNHEMVTSNIWKPEPMMGAFLQLQHSLNTFQIHLETPSMDHAPFSRILSFLTEEQSLLERHIDSPPLPEHQGSALETQLGSEPALQSHEWDESNIQETLNFQESIFCEPQLLLMESRVKPTWEEKDPGLNWLDGFEVHCSQNASVLMHAEQELHPQKLAVCFISDDALKPKLLQMLQGVESELFTLEYKSRMWYHNFDTYAFETMTNSSLSLQLADIIKIASKRTQLETALHHLKGRPYRRVYDELSRCIRKFLYVYDQILLESQNCSLIDLVCVASGCQTELDILYDLLLSEVQCQDWNALDHRHIRAEFLIYKKVLKLCISSDSAPCGVRFMLLELFSGIMKPTVSLLNRALSLTVEECLGDHQSAYLTLHYENGREILKVIQNKLAMIRQESTKLYFICRIHHPLHFITNLRELLLYDIGAKEHVRDQLAKIRAFREEHYQSITEEQTRARQQRVKQLSLLKAKHQKTLYDLQQQKSMRFQRLSMLAEQQKAQFEAREKESALKKQIELEKEKSLLLNQELKKRQNLKTEKDKLLQVTSNTAVNKISTQKMDATPAESTQRALVNQVSLENIGVLEKQKITANKEQPIKLADFPSLALLEGEKAISKDRKDQSVIGSEVSLSLSPDLEQPVISNQPKSTVGSISKAAQIKRLAKMKGFMARASHFGSQTYVSKEGRSTSSLPAQSYEEVLAHQIHQEKQLELKLQNLEEVNCLTMLEVCIDSPLKRHVQVLNAALNHLIVDKHQVLEIFNFLHEVFLSADGALQNDLLQVAVDSNSQIDLQHFHKCLVFDSCPFHYLEPQFFRTSGTANKANSYSLSGKMSLLDGTLAYSIGFQFKALPNILENFFDYIVLNHYVSIFCFLLQIKHCQTLCSLAWKSLNIYCRLQKRDTSFVYLSNPDDFNPNMLRTLTRLRHFIHNFINLFQNYVFFKVISKEVNQLLAKCAFSTNPDEIPAAHKATLENMLRHLFLQAGPFSQMRNWIKQVWQFGSIVQAFCCGDITVHRRNEVVKRVETIEQLFKNKHKLLCDLYYHE